MTSVSAAASFSGEDGIGQRLRFQAGVDRQQRQHRRQRRVVAELDRAHRGAPGRGRQHAAAGVGEEDGVDQLRLAARELGDEGHAQAVARQALAQRGEVARAGVVLELVLLQEMRQIAGVAVERSAPRRQGVELSGERRVERGTVHGFAWFRTMLSLNLKT
jgi:hypothetical protein